jgi:S-adenosyl-L-methionine hydrolase (adenosine-forming)
LPGGPDTVFFLSDFGSKDEFAGVVRAVLRRLAPAAVVIDLTHEIPPFDVAAGARTLLRALPYLGPGVVLAVVDPGVGSARRGVALAVGEREPRMFVGPDNGLLLPAAELAGGPIAAVELERGAPEPDATTFDGRDLFAPAVAALCNGSPLAELGTPIDPDTLVRLLLPLSRHSRLADGRIVRWAQVTWVDRFGNLQLSASPSDEDPEVFALAWPEGEGGASGAAAGRMVRKVGAFAELRAGELGVIVDANRRLALVVREGSAAELLGVGTGQVVGLAEPPA